MVVGGEINDDWLWFLTVLHDFLGWLKPVIMSNRNKGLVAAVPLVFRKENHNYCVRLWTENVMEEASKFGIRRDVPKELVQNMFNRVVYATTAAEYESEMAELRRYQRESTVWTQENEPECWA